MLMAGLVIGQGVTLDGVDDKVFVSDYTAFTD